MSAQLRLDAKSFSRSKMGTVFASIWFEVDNESFPSKAWSDLAPAFIRAWLLALFKLVSGKSQNEKVYFMDGPYAVEIASGGLDLLEMRFIDRKRDNEVILFSTKSETRSCLANAISVAEQVAKVYRKNNWQDDDETRIHTHIAIIRKFLIRNTQ
jgi:hypothetical protein